MRTASAIVLATLVMTGALAAVAGVGAGAAANANANSVSSAQDNESSAYAGTHVTFEASGNALTDYQVGGEAVFDRVAVESKESHTGGAGLGADVGLEAVTNLEGLGLSIAAQSQTRAEVETEGSASMTAHDTDRGILTVDAGGEGQYVQVDLSGDAEASANGDRVVVRGGDDTADENESEPRNGTFLVVGDGNVTVNDDGNVTADLEGDSKLVFRSYADGERGDDAEAQEDMIANGTATAEVYVEERGGEFVQDVAIYGQDIAVEATEQSEERVEMAVERTEHEGTVVITTVSEAVAGAENTSVTVDGEAAVEASSYSDLEGAIGSDESRYMVTQQSAASANADVLVAVNHFSERTVAIGSADAETDGEDSNETDDSTESDDSNQTGDSDSSSDDSTNDDGSPGFGIVAALVATLLTVGARVRR
ncbi:hypothetical protein [Halomontanus rarus]|uniref:hypothetical protein n=1 Tax=Halomontanus rarus TaxID=3034020 RepID=UPI001A9987CA